MLFDRSQIDHQMKAANKIDSQSSSITSETGSKFFEGNSLAELTKTIGTLEKNKHVHFVTKGSWSTHNLIEYLVRKIGKCDLYFMTYSIHEETFRNLHKLIDEKLICSVHALLDYRIEKTKAESFQFARELMSSYGQTKCHAKVTVLINEEWAVSITGSSNMTKNRKLESGIICTERKAVEFYRDFILKEINNG
jgi:hypothetical protein